MPRGVACGDGMKQWEYMHRMFKGEKPLLVWLNEIGGEGWECFRMPQEQPHGLYWFKRVSEFGVSKIQDDFRDQEGDFDITDKGSARAATG